MHQAKERKKRIPEQRERKETSDVNNKIPIENEIAKEHGYVFSAS